jgi:hypothetical protein
MSQRHNRLAIDHTQARLNSFEEYPNLTGNDSSVAVSILSVGFVLPSKFYPKGQLLTTSKLCPHANSQKHDLDQNPTIVVHAFLGLHLVLHLRVNGRNDQFRWPGGRAILFGYC